MGRYRYVRFTSSIALDDEIPNLLIVGAYREDEVPDSHPLALHLRELEETGIELTTIKIDNLSAANVKALVADALSKEDNEDAVKTLADIVHKKTDGNAFFVLLFLRSLHEEELLQYNFGTMSWKWDDKAVSARLATDNVATVLVDRLKRLHEGAQNILKIAACLGNKFSTSSVVTVTDNVTPVKLRRLSSTATATESESEDDHTAVNSDIDTSVNELEEYGLLEKENIGVWCFSHDKIQSAAFEHTFGEKRSVPK